MMFKLEQTCGACPEQYQVYLGKEWVGYMRLRYGHFYCTNKDNEVVYSHTFMDGYKGCFDDDEERNDFLNDACYSLKIDIENKQEKQAKLFEFVDNIEDD